MLEMVIGFFLKVIVPVFLICWVILFKCECRFNWLARSFGVFSYIVYVYFTSDWRVYSYLWIYFIILAFVVALIKSYIEIRKKPFFSNKKYGSWFVARVAIFLGILLLYQAGIAIKISNTFSKDKVNLSFPLKDGIYSISNIATSPRNGYTRHEYFTEVPKIEKFSIDISKVNNFLVEGNKLKKDSLEDFEIYNETVYSPCNGTVVRERSDLKDYRENSSSFVTERGNYIIIRDERGYYIILENLKLGSILVKEGDVVRVGESIGKIGNSAKSQYPHLHIYASKSLEHSTDGLRIEFDGKTLFKNRLFFK